MRKSFIICAIGLCSILLSGCTMGTVLNTNQNEVVAQYIAQGLYKRSYSFQNKYPDYNIVIPGEQETTTEEETPAIIPSDTSSENQTTIEEETTKDNTPTAPGKVFPVSEDLKIAPIQVTYQSYRFADEYPDDEDALFYFTPEPGYKLLIVSLNLINPTGNDVTISTVNQETVFRLTFDDGKFTSNYNTIQMIPNDLAQLDEFVIPANSSQECVLVFMVNASKVNDFGTVTISYGNSSIEFR